MALMYDHRPVHRAAPRSGRTPLRMSDAAIVRLHSTAGEIAQRVPPAVRLALKVLLVGAVCSLSTKLGFALKFPPHYISPLWPTGAILFSVLVVAPRRHWWAYILAAYFTSVLTDVRAGFPAWAMLFIAAGLGEILIAAIGVRRFANGVRAFDSLRSLVIYIVVAVVLAPFLSAFVAAFAGVAENYWFYWRVWFLSDALAYLMVAPAILTCIGAVRSAGRNVSLARVAEAGLIAGGLLVVSIRVFFWPIEAEARLPALVYLPLPFLLWAAVRFGPGRGNYVSAVRRARLDLRYRSGTWALRHEHPGGECARAAIVPVRDFPSVDAPGGVDRGTARPDERPSRERGTVSLDGRYRARPHLDVG